MFHPMMYSTWEKLMVSTGQPNNKIFPTLLISLGLGMLGLIYNIVKSVFFKSSVVPGSNNQLSFDALLAATSSTSGEEATWLSIALQSAFILVPLSIALWGATLFKPGNQGAGFAQPGNAAKVLDSSNDNNKSN